MGRENTGEETKGPLRYKIRRHTLTKESKNCGIEEGHCGVEGGHYKRKKLPLFRRKSHSM